MPAPLKLTQHDSELCEVLFSECVIRLQITPLTETVKVSLTPNATDSDELTNIEQLITSGLPVNPVNLL